MNFDLTLIFIFNTDIFLVASILNCVLNTIAKVAIWNWTFTYGAWLQIAQWGLELIMNLIITILIAYKAWSVFFSMQRPYLYN